MPWYGLIIRIGFDDRVGPLQGAIEWLEACLKTIELSDKELTYLLIALRNQEQILAQSSEETLEDALVDLLVVQGLIDKLTAVKAGSGIC